MKNTTYTNNQRKEFIGSKALYGKMENQGFFGIELVKDRVDREMLNVMGNEDEDISNIRVAFVAGDEVKCFENDFRDISVFSLIMNMNAKIFAAKVKLEGDDVEMYFSSGDKDSLFHCWFDIERDEDAEEGINIYCSNALIGTYTGIILAHDGYMDTDIETQAFHDAMIVAMENSVKR